MKAKLVHSKFNEFVHALENLPTTAHRVDESLIAELKDALSKTNQQGSSGSGVNPNVWSMNPKKLTEHQREKMKERRCDIPALYNDNSRSQDSMSIQGWTPTDGATAVINNTTIPLIPKSEKSTESAEEAQRIPLETSDCEMSEMQSQADTANDMSLETSDSEISSSQGQSQPKMAKFMNKIEMHVDDSVDNKTKQRITRELNRIHIDAVDALPLETLSEVQRKTRSAKKDTTPLRQTRSSAEKNDQKTRRSSITAVKTGGTPTPVAKLTPHSKGKSASASRKLSNGEADSNDSTPNIEEDSPIMEKKDVLTPINRAQRLQRRLEGNVSAMLESMSDKQTRRMAKRSTSDDVQSAVMDDTNGVLKENSVPVVIKKEPDDNEDIQESMPSVSTKQSPTNDEETQITNGTTNYTVNGNHDDDSEEVDNTLPETDVIAASQSPVKLTMIQENSPKKSQTKHSNEPTTAEMLEQTKDLKIIIPDIAIQGMIAHSSTMAADPHPTNIENHENDMHMSALIYDQSTDASHLNASLNQSIMTSPRVDDEKNQEFLNDTLNISPISHDHLNEIVNEVVEELPEPTEAMDTDDTHASTSSVCRKLSIDSNVTANDNEAKSTKVSNTVAQSPMHTPTLTAKPASALLSSTPIMSSINSPVSSRYRSQLTGRGAQLLNMINAKNSMSPQVEVTAPVPPPPITGTPVQTAPPPDAVASPVHVPDYPATPIADVLRTPQMELLTIGGPLPSPLESPRFSILKRKARDLIDEEGSSSPAHKKKRVSFNYPLSVTKEYITDDQAESAMDGDNDGAVSTVKILRNKCKLRRKSRQDSARDINKYSMGENGAQSDSQLPQEQQEPSTQPSTSSHQDEVNVSDMKEYLDKTVEMVVRKFEVIDDDDESLLHTNDGPNGTNLERPRPLPMFVQPLPILPPLIRAPTTLDSFSDSHIFQHMFNRLENGDPVAMARLLANQVSSVMCNDGAFSRVFLDELAGHHPVDFLEVAHARNETAVACDSLIASNSDGVVERFTEYINGDEDIREKVLTSFTTGLSNDNRAEAVERLSDSLNGNGNDDMALPMHVNSIATRAFRNNDMSPDEFVNIIQHYFVRRSERHEAEQALNAQQAGQ